MYAGYGNEIIFASLVTREVDSICPGSRLWIWLTAVGGFIGVFILCYLCLVIWRKRRTKDSEKRKIVDWRKSFSITERIAQGFVYLHTYSRIIAWKLWNEGKGIEIMDQSLLESCIMDEVRRCIQVGLLCVQDCAADRPSMSEVVSMLSNENVLLPNPKPTAFYINEASDEPNGSAENQNACSINEATISVMDKR
ncbi:hypothetical protein L6164_021018 [Bauhinia variegata]|uniref:Uncharacterized protein n=1 Tax=Bauhinia variegata TaxID=167791 RepID=A0ACB9MY64_BAUVA|nr:hypothetical protein L6164_021018 [Bauhinia variegata]